jgi:hypothetical protein
MVVNPLCLGFDSDMVISHYYAGISTTLPLWDNATHDCTAFLEQNVDVYDVTPLQRLEEEDMTVVSSLKLQVGICKRLALETSSAIHYYGHVAKI